MVSGLEAGFLLDQRWHRMTSGTERSKKPDLVLLARVLGDAQVAYAVIGGLALQVQAEPRTTLDIDLAVRDRPELPRVRLEAAGFKETGNFAHSDNWVGPGGTPIQFMDDPALAPALGRADEIKAKVSCCASCGEPTCFTPSYGRPQIPRAGGPSASRTSPTLSRCSSRIPRRTQRYRSGLAGRPAPALNEGDLFLQRDDHPYDRR
jgi:hypothetical protein